MHGVAGSWAEALDLTPNQIVEGVKAMNALRSGGPTSPRRMGTKDEFKAAVLGFLG